MIRLYKGDNGVQNFWESEDKRVLLMQVKGEKTWQFWSYGKLYHKEGFGILDPNANLMSKSLTKLSIKVEELLNHELIFDASKQFVPVSDNWKGNSMRLKRVFC